MVEAILSNGQKYCFSKPKHKYQGSIEESSVRDFPQAGKQKCREIKTSQDGVILW